jgi:peptide/nickel transport system permease protein
VREDLAAAYGGSRPGEAADAHVDEVHVAALPQVSPEDPPPKKFKYGVFFWLCVGWLGILVFGSTFTPWLHLHNPNNSDFSAGANAGISAAHWLGTDQAARDTFSRLVWGARASLIVGLIGTAIGMGIGGTLGLLSAYVRGRFDAALAFFMYCGLAFPAIIAIIAILDFWGVSQWHVVLVLGLASVPLIYRLVRSATLATATKEYVTAAKSQGATSFRVLLHDVFPNVAPALLVYTVFTLGGIVTVQGVIAFLGIATPGASWGGMISDASADLYATNAFIFSTAIALFLTLIALYYVAERLRQRYDTLEVRL